MTEVIWAADRRVVWPRPTRGYWFIAQAVDLIGSYVFGDDWRIEDMQAHRLFPREKPSFVEGAAGGRSLTPGAAAPLTRDQRVRAHEELCQQIDQENAAATAHNIAHSPAIRRRLRVEGIIAAAAADRRLTAYYRSIADLSDQPIPASYWATIWWPIVFREGRIPGASWMREVDQPFTSDVFVLEDEVRAIDWLHVDVRAEPAPLASPKTERTPEVDVRATDDVAHVARGRPKGTTLYGSDEQIVERVIRLCDSGAFAGKARVRRAIKSLIEEIEPANLDDESKIRRIKPKVEAARPDLAN